jgi:cell division protease FtsH
MDNRDKLNQLAEILLQKEVIFREDLEKIFGKRPFPDHDHVMINSNGDTNEKKVAEPGDVSAEVAGEADSKSMPDQPENNDESAVPGSNMLS